MEKLFIFDGNNMMYVCKVFRDLKPWNKESAVFVRILLKRIIQKFQESQKGTKVILMFDFCDLKLEKELRKVNEVDKTKFEVISAQPKVKIADDLIVDFVKKEKENFKEIVVVTSDRELKFRLKDEGIKGKQLINSKRWLIKFSDKKGRELEDWIIKNFTTGLNLTFKKKKKFKVKKKRSFKNGFKGKKGKKMKFKDVKEEEGEEIVPIEELEKKGIDEIYFDSNNMFYLSSVFRSVKPWKSKGMAIVSDSLIKMFLAFHKEKKLKETHILFDTCKKVRIDKNQDKKNGIYLYSARPKWKTADDLLVELAGKKKDLSKTAFVTSDVELINRLKQKGASIIIKPGTWIKFFSKATDKKKIDDWIKKNYF